MPDILRVQGHRTVAVDVAPPLRPHPDRLTGSLPSLGLAPRQFDLSFAFQAFEHLPEPRPILDEMLRLTRDGGLVLIHTDMEVPARNGGLEDWWYVTPPDHCSFYRHRSFDVVLRDTPHAIEWRDAKTVLIRTRWNEKGARRNWAT